MPAPPQAVRGRLSSERRGARSPRLRRPGARSSGVSSSCETPQRVCPASLTLSTVSVCQDRKKIWRSIIRDHSGLPGGAADE